MNDPDTLGLYTAMQIFRSDQNAACLEFPPTLTHQQRSIVHTLAARLDLDHARGIEIGEAPEAVPRFTLGDLLAIEGVAARDDGDGFAAFFLRDA